jgi:Domain of unknown function DUF29
MQSLTQTQNLHGKDFYAWCKVQATALRAQNIAALDLQNLSHEINAIATRERRELRTNYRELIVLLLKMQYRPETRKSGAIVETIRFRDIILNIEFDSPALKAESPLLIAQCYERARLEASLATSLPLITFPDHCPYTLEQLHDDYYVP